MMKTIVYLQTLLVIMGFVACKNEKENNQKWYKGNLHTHSYWSDGDEFPEMIMDWYKNKAYDFVALSDHNTLAKADFWKTIPINPLNLKGFSNYLNKYKDEVIYTKNGDTIKVKLKKFKEYKSYFEEKEKFLILPAEEITTNHKKRPIHINAINLQNYVPPQQASSMVEVIQKTLNIIHQQEKKTGHPMLAQINHPNFGYGVSIDDMKQLENNRFFEVFNGHPSVNNRGNDTIMSTENMWDIINISYLNQGKKLLYGIATDDSHHYHKIGKQWSNAGRGWVVVKADSLNANAIFHSMKNGKFYSSIGIELIDLSFKNNTISLKIKPGENINYKIAFIGCLKNEIETRVLEEIKGTEANFKLTSEMLFVRAKITSDKKVNRPTTETNYEEAWTQPVIFEN